MAKKEKEKKTKRQDSKILQISSLLKLKYYKFQIILLAFQFSAVLKSVCSKIIFIQHKGDSDLPKTTLFEGSL